jgi:5'/3'-nucleotidase SurE
MNFLSHAMIVAIVGVVLSPPADAAEPDVLPPPKLRILLTNDDGYGAPGITTVRDALLEAGHEVTVVAPSGDESGSGGRVTTRGTIDYAQRSSGEWSVDGSPADAVLVGLLHIMEEQPPDLVVSGANFGQNLGYAINSGTVGAATVAMYVGIPAIAVSVGVDLSERDALPLPFPTTFQAFGDAAELSVQVIDELQRAGSGGGRLLPEHTILNINYPALRRDEIKGVRVSKAARSAGVRIGYEETGDAGRLRIAIDPLEPTAESKDTDWELFARGFVTISVLDGDWDAGQPLRNDVMQRLSVSGQD